MGWAAKEFEGIYLGDKRPDKRAVLLAERLAGTPTASDPWTSNGPSRGCGRCVARRSAAFTCTRDML